MDNIDGFFPPLVCVHALHAVRSAGLEKMQGINDDWLSKRASHPLGKEACDPIDGAALTPPRRKTDVTGCWSRP
jgi:hypothetical protein